MMVTTALMPEHKIQDANGTASGLKATASAGLFCEFNSTTISVDRLGQTSLVILLLKGNVTLLTHT